MNSRKNIRANLSVQVVMMGTSHEGLPYKVSGTSTDFSRKGIGVVLDQNVAAPGSVVTILYGNKFQSNAEIKWVKQDPKTNRFRVGLRLIQPRLSAGFKIAASLLLCWAFLVQAPLTHASTPKASAGRSDTVQTVLETSATTLSTALHPGQAAVTHFETEARAETHEEFSWIEPSIRMATNSKSNAGYAQIDIRMSKETYRFGDTVAANLYHLSNPSDFEKQVEVKTWLSIPGTAPVPIGNVGADGLFSLAPGAEEEYGPIQLMPVISDLPAGKYEFNARAIDPVTGDVISERINPFSIATPSETPKAISKNNGPSLSVDFQISSSSYSYGDTVASISGFRIANQDTTATSIELKIWLEAPGLQPIAIFSLGADGTLVLTPGSSMKLEPLQPFKITPTLPSGTYQLKTKVLDPTTGQRLLETINSFSIR